MQTDYSSNHFTNWLHQTRLTNYSYKITI